MLKKIRVFIVAVLCAVSLVGCADIFDFGSDVPDVGIDWEYVQNSIDKTAVSERGWYMDDGEIDEFGTITFYNYDFNKLKAFKEVPYQFYIEYGCGYELVDGESVYYEHPVYSIMLVDNASDKYYACTYDDTLQFMNEEGDWFLSDVKSEYVNDCLLDCQAILGLDK